MRKTCFFVLALFLSFMGCRRPKPAGNEVRVLLLQDPENLNPVSYTSKDASQLINLLYQSLLTVDLADGKLKPLLAEAMPVVTKNNSITLFTYRIRTEATWANGSPVTAADVALTLKTLNCPLVNNEKRRPDFDFIQDIRPDNDDPKKFTLVCTGYSPEHLLMSGDFFVMPAYLFDPENRLGSYTLPQLKQQFETLTANPAIQQFAESFNSARFTRDPNYLQGSAGYLLAAWQTGKQIQFSKKENWWGNTLPEPVSHITANPEKISFQIAPDPAAAFLALKNNRLDVWQNMPAPIFEQASRDNKLAGKLQFFTPPTYSFAYLGFNSRLEKLADKRTRQALAHLLDLDAIIKTTQRNLAVKTIGPISPADKTHYHAQIQPYSYNIAQAEMLLGQAGWRKNGTVWERKTNNQAMPLTLQVSYNAANAEFENIALILQQAAAKLGIAITLQPLEGSTFSKNLKQGNFELFIRSMSGNPFVYNFKPVFHTEAAGPDGLNYTGFGTPESDRIIETLYAAQSAEQETKLLKRLQEILHDESNLVFLYFQRDRIAVHKRFSNLKISGIKPGYDVSAFTLNNRN